MTMNKYELPGPSSGSPGPTDNSERPPEKAVKLGEKIWRLQVIDFLWYLQIQIFCLTSLTVTQKFYKHN